MRVEEGVKGENVWSLVVYFLNYYFQRITSFFLRAYTFTYEALPSKLALLS